MTPDAVMRELAGLHALARSLVHGDADADDLIQDTAIAAIEHPPDEDRAVRPWLATVLRNRWRMDRRGRGRRQAREHEVALGDIADAEATPDAPDAIDRARTLEKLASALVGLDEPFRAVVIRRYLDGQSAAEIARALNIPAGTVRWRLKTGLERLRAAMDRSTPRWQRALVPFAAVKGAAVMKAKATIVSLIVLLLLVGGGIVALLVKRGDSGADKKPVATVTKSAKQPGLAVTNVTGQDDAAPLRPDRLPGQGRVVVEPVAIDGGVLGGRVINWSTGEGVAGAELTFTSAAGAVTVRTGKEGAFELAPPKPTMLSLTTIIAPGFLPYAPEFQHSSVRIALGAKQAVRGLTLFLFPALDYYGTVVDAAGAPVAGAKVKMADPPAGEQVIEKIVTEWTTDKQGTFVFHAPDFTVFEALKGSKRGWAVVDGNVATTHKMVIKIGDAAARDATIKGKTVDASGAPVADVLITAVPEDPGRKGESTRSVAFATSGPDGGFVLDGLDRQTYTLVAELDEYAPVNKDKVAGGTQNVTLTLDEGQPLAGVVRDPDDKPVPAYTLLVTKREGLVREVLTTRSVIDPRGHFEVRMPKGDYELLAYATGWAPSEPVKEAAGTTDAKIQLTGGATLQGVVVDADTGAPLEYARVTREGAGGGASASPANAGTVTRSDGTFELTGIPAGPFTVSIGAGDYHPRLEAGLVATEGGVLGPIKVAMKKLAEGEVPKIELVGIGVKLSADGEALKVEMVVPESGAAAAGITVGDHIVAIDGVPVTTLGMEGSVSRIRGVAHTKLAVSIKRGEQIVPLVVERLPIRV
ncbi:MAG TPA: sigma-70 family RNA polymerase sigma factor [Kofleriaceae bacterium]|nr:sigma-70 family RNA polymerase sigma factor [Kofleriaceae bacterium]